MSKRAKELEKLDLERTAETVARAEEAKAVVLESAGELLDAARADPDFEVPEENTSIKRLADITGRSGTHAATATEPCPPPEGPITRRPTQLDTAPRTEQVLVVEDDPDIAAELAHVLRDEGYRVRTAEDGIEALRKTLKETPSPDVLVLDLGLPFLSGEGVVAALQTTPFAAIPILFISAMPASSVPLSVRGDHVYIQKSSAMTERLKAEMLKVVAQRVAEWRARMQ